MAVIMPEVVEEIDMMAKGLNNVIGIEELGREHCSALLTKVILHMVNHSYTRHLTVHVAVKDAVAFMLIG